MRQYFVFDFDSTFISVETLDILCEIAFEQKAGIEEALREIKLLTDLGMVGRLAVKESLE